MKQKKRDLPAILAVAVVLLDLLVGTVQAAPLAEGTVIGVDFGPTAPVDNYNQYDSAVGGSIAAGSLVDTSGVVVAGVSLTVSAPAMWSNNDAADSTDLPGQPSVLDDTHLTDWIGENTAGVDIDLTFSGLNDALTYELVIGSAFTLNATATDTDWTVDGQTATSVHDSGANAYVTFTGLATDGSGHLVITSDPSNTVNITVVSALTLTAFAGSPIRLSSLAAGNTDTNSATLSVLLGGTNADVTVYWEAGAVADPAAHSGWDGTNGPAAAIPGTVQRAAVGLAADTSYAYAFYATNATLGTSVWSTVDTFATGLTDAQAPLVTSATARSAASIALGWQNNASNLTGFVLQRSDTGAGGPYTTIATPASTATSYADSGLSASTTYHYQLAATNSSNGSATRFSLAQTNATTRATFPIAEGTVIGVDFGPTAPDNSFNQGTGGPDSIAAGSLIDTNNVVVDGVGFSWDTGGMSDASLTEAEKNGQPAVFSDSNLTDWLIVVGGAGHITLTFSGLNDFATYDLLIGSAFSDHNPDTTWSADGQSDTTDSTVGADAYVTLTGLSTDRSGNLVITSAGAGTRTDISVVSALTLTALGVPDPSSIHLAFPAVSDIATNSATLSAFVAFTNAVVTAYWEAGVVPDPAAHTGWDGFHGPAAESTGTIQRTASALNADTLYSYAFYGTNTVLGASVWSSVETFATSLGDAQAPGFTNATALSSSSIELGWQNNASNLTGFVLQRSDTGVGGPYTTIATLASTATAYTDGGLSASTPYHYQLAATNSSNGSATAFSLSRTHATTTGPVPLAAGRIIGIDIGTTTTPNWNNIVSQIQTIAAGSVVDTSGAVVEGVSIVADIGEGGAVQGSSWPGWTEFPADSLPDVPESVTVDFSFANGGGDHDLVIRGLGTAATYDIAVITQTGTAVVRIDTVTVTGASVTNSIIPRYVAGGAVDSSYEGLYHSFTNVMPSVDGSIAINTVDNAGNPSINAVRMEVVRLLPTTGIVIMLR